MDEKVKMQKVPWNVPVDRHPEEGKNYKVISDPELRPNCAFIYRYNGISTNNHEPILVCDPRGQSISSQRKSLVKPTGLLIPDYALESYLGRSLLRYHSDKSSTLANPELPRHDRLSPRNRPAQFQNYTNSAFGADSASSDRPIHDRDDRRYHQEVRSRKHRHTSHECDDQPRKRRRHHHHYHRMNENCGINASSHSSNISTPNLFSDGVGRSSEINSPQFSSAEPKESLDSRIANLLGNRPNVDQAGSSSTGIGGVQQILQTGPTQNFVLNPMFVQGGVVNIPYYEPNINVPAPIGFQQQHTFAHGHPPYMTPQPSSNQFL